MLEIKFYLPKRGFDTTDGPIQPQTDTSKDEYNLTEGSGSIAQATDAGGDLPDLSFQAACKVPTEADSELADFVKAIKSLPEGDKRKLEMLVQDVLAGRCELKFDRRTDCVTVKNLRLQAALKARIPENTLKMSNVSHSSFSAKQFELDVFCDFLDLIKTNSVPEGVIFYDAIMKLGSDKRYKEGLNFEPQNLTLGTGLNATITVSIDTGTNKKYARKTITVNNFRSNEIRAMFAFNSSGITPKLYGLQLHDRNITVFMEILDKGMTVFEVVNQLVNFESDPYDRYDFALIVLKEMLRAAQKIHSIGWFHCDLHSENVMIEKSDDQTINIKLLDFGNSFCVEYDSQHSDGQYKAWISDSCNILKQFYSIATCSNDLFEDIFDFKNNHDLKMEMFTENFLPNDIRSGMSDIIKRGLKVKTSPDEQIFIDSLSCLQTERDSGSQSIVELIFNQLQSANTFQNLHSTCSMPKASVPVQSARSPVDVHVPEDLRSAMSNVAAGIRNVRID